MDGTFTRGQQRLAAILRVAVSARSDRVPRLYGAGRFYGLDAIVEKIAWVRATPKLRYVLG